MNLEPFEPTSLPRNISINSLAGNSHLIQSQKIPFDQQIQKPVQMTQQPIINYPTLNAPPPVKQSETSSPQKVELPSSVTYARNTVIGNQPTVMINQPQTYYQPPQITNTQTRTTYTINQTFGKQEIENNYEQPRESESSTRPKVELDLSKIDEQLQMSRKMFP